MNITNEQASSIIHLVRQGVGQDVSSCIFEG